jgi:atypical dual specificity phosphatase
MLNNFGYVIDNELAGCAHPDSHGDCYSALSELRERGIASMVSVDELGVPLYLIAEHGFTYLHLPVRDFHPPTIEQAEQFVEFVQNQRSEGKAVVVHCRGGFGRTGTMLACYLAAEGKGARQAIEEVRRRRPGSIETEEQEDFVYAFEKALAEKFGKRERRKKPRS